jgi:hypothetical protein
MPIITIAGQVIDYPDDGSSPDWAPAVIQFSQIVATTLNSLLGAFDIPNQSFTIDSYNPGTNIPIPGFFFSPTAVRGGVVEYSVYRNTTTTTVVETGELLLAYNQNGTPGSLWEMTQTKAGNADITFTMLDSGQMEFTTTVLGGLSHNGVISFVGKALLRS